MLCVGAGRAQQALATVGGNALKCTPDGGQMTLGAMVTDTEGILRVHNAGIGIPEADQRRA